MSPVVESLKVLPTLKFAGAFILSFFTIAFQCDIFNQKRPAFLMYRYILNVLFFNLRFSF